MRTTYVPLLATLTSLTTVTPVGPALAAQPALAADNRSDNSPFTGGADAAADPAASVRAATSDRATERFATTRAPLIHFRTSAKDRP